MAALVLGPPLPASSALVGRPDRAGEAVPRHGAAEGEWEGLEERGEAGEGEPEETRSRSNGDTAAGAAATVGPAMQEVAQAWR